MASHKDMEVVLVVLKILLLVEVLEQVDRAALGVASWGLVVGQVRIRALVGLDNIQEVEVELRDIGGLVVAGKLGLVEALEDIMVGAGLGI